MSVYKYMYLSACHYTELCTIHNSSPSTSKFVKQILIQNLITVFASHWEKYVASNKFMDNFTLCWDTLENHIFFIAKLNHHVSSLPIDIPGLRWQIINRSKNDK